MRSVWLLLVVACGSRAAPEVAPRPPPPTRTQLVMLGTGNPMPDPDRSGPATAVVVDGVAYLFDCGPGVVRRASAAAKQHDLAALQPTRLQHLFVTHLHSDHTLGYADLIFTPWVVGRAAPLEVYGPPGISAMTEHLRAAYAEDVAIRTEGLEDADRASSVPNVHEVTAGLVFQDAHVKITAFPVHHGSWPHAFGYRIEGPDRTIVITGDYSPTDSVVTACAGCDVLVTEGYPTLIVEHQPERRAYMESFHISAVELGALATRAREARRHDAPPLVDSRRRRRRGDPSRLRGPGHARERPRPALNATSRLHITACTARGHACKRSDAVTMSDTRCAAQRATNDPRPTRADTREA